LKRAVRLASGSGTSRVSWPGRFSAPANSSTDGNWMLLELRGTANHQSMVDLTAWNARTDRSGTRIDKERPEEMIDGRKSDWMEAGIASIEGRPFGQRREGFYAGDIHNLRRQPIGPGRIDAEALAWDPGRPFGAQARETAVTQASLSLNLGYYRSPPLGLRSEKSFTALPFGAQTRKTVTQASLSLSLGYHRPPPWAQIGEILHGVAWWGRPPGSPW
jgi:hypothetical protein